MERRGRPKSVVNETVLEQPQKFTREYKKHDGHRSVWTYDLKKSPFGPILVEEFYPPGHMVLAEVEEHLTKTKRTYLNEKNGKLVGYTRARALGLIK